MSGSRFSKRLRNLSPSPQPDLDEFMNHERRKQHHIQKIIQDSQSEKIVQQQPQSVEHSLHNVTVRVQERNEEEQDILKTVVSPPKLMYKKAAKLYTEQQRQQPSIQSTLGYPQQAESSTMGQARRNISGRSNQKEEQLVKKKNPKIQQTSDEFKEIEDSVDDPKIDKSQDKGKYVPKKNIIKASKSPITALQVVKMIPDKRKQKNPKNKHIKKHIEKKYQSISQDDNTRSSSTHVVSNNNGLLNGIQELRSTVVAQREKLEDLFKELKNSKSSLTQEDGSIRDPKDEPTKQRLQELIDQYNEYTNNNLVQEELLNPTIELLEAMIDKLPFVYSINNNT